MRKNKNFLKKILSFTIIMTIIFIQMMEIKSEAAIEDFFSINEIGASTTFGTKSISIIGKDCGTYYLFSHEKPNNYYYTEWSISVDGNSSTKGITKTGTKSVSKSNRIPGKHTISISCIVYTNHWFWGMQVWGQGFTKTFSYTTAQKNISLTKNRNSAYEGQYITVYNNGNATGVKWSYPSWLTLNSSSDKQAVFYCKPRPGYGQWGGEIVASAPNATTKRTGITVYADSVKLNIGGQNYYNGGTYNMTVNSSVKVSASAVSGADVYLSTGSSAVASLSSTYKAGTLTAKSKRSNDIDCKE